MATTIHYYDWDAPGPIDGRKRSIEVVFTRRTFDVGPAQGWYVRRADNGRILGWVISPNEAGHSETWIAYAADGAFRGDDINDEGDTLDKVPTSLTRRGNGYRAIAGDTRLEATGYLIQEMCREHATALGFGRHPQVARHLADRPALREYFKNGMVGEYPHKENR